MKLVVVEDDHMLRGNLTMLLGGERHVDLVGSFESAEEALPEIIRRKPDVALVDIGLPGRSGIELIEDICAELPDMAVMAHTIFDDRDTVFAAIKAGASGYLLKGSSPREIVEALAELSEGGAPMTPKIARAVIREFQESKVDEQYLLSVREQQILKGLEGGLTYQELGDSLHISPHTVHSHIKHIYEKLHAVDRKSALIHARKKGLL